MNHKNTSPDYGNWVHIAMMKGMAAVLLALLALTIVLAWLLPFPLPAVLTGILTAVLFLLWLYMLRCRALFDFSRGGLMGKLHQYLLDHLDWNGRGRLLEIGCGSGALLKPLREALPTGQFHRDRLLGSRVELCQRTVPAKRSPGRRFGPGNLSKGRRRPSGFPGPDL